MNTKTTGGILLIVGTSIGGGMLALPITSASSGFIASSLMLGMCWVVMTLSALLVLEVNLWLPPRNNMITMARTTLGRFGAYATWVSYILLLYSLLSAYIAGGTDVVHSVLQSVHLTTPSILDTILFVIIFASIVILGIRPVDYVNRLLMLGKFGSLFVLITLTLPHIKAQHLLEGDPHQLPTTVMVMMTSFGYATIIPSLRSYFNSDVKQLRRVILLGSTIPLVCYVLWNLTILGTVPSHGANGLATMAARGGAATDLTQALRYFLQKPWVTSCAHFFTVICVLTAFLSVSLGLSDFIADRLHLEKRGRSNILIYGLTFLPSLLIVLFDPRIFIAALNYAGVCCVILLVLLPALMVWRGRYVLSLAQNSHFHVPGGRWVLGALLLIAIIIIGCAIKATLN